nr:hypothetical protein CKG001_23470 [Bdellovibrio sp. CKG001]
MANIQAILSICAVKNYPATYLIGQNDRFGISIIEQQQKALGLAWALIESGKVKKNSKIAIVGGGFSGLTCALALSSKAKCKVKIFEKRSCLLPILDNAYWRWITPFQEYLDTEFYSDQTDLPFLNWKSNFGWAIARQIRSKWAKYSRQYGIETILNAHVSVPKAIKEKPKVIVKNRHLEFDIVILATGFGIETTSHKFDPTTYWTSGFKENYINTSNSKKTVFISGTGDGGIVEACHYAFENFVHDEINQLYPSIYGLALQEILQNFERHRSIAAQKDIQEDNLQFLYWCSSPKTKKSLDLINKLRSLPPSRRRTTRLKLLKIYQNENQEKYSSWIKDFKFIKQDLDLLRSRSSNRFRIIMNGKNKDPFTISDRTNPFNQLLLSAMIQLGLVTYKCATIDTKAIRRNRNKIVVPIQTTRGKTLIHADRLVLRHGSKNHFKKEFPKLKVRENYLVEEDGSITDWSSLRQGSSFLREYFRDNDLMQFILDNRIDDVTAMEGARFLELKKRLEQEKPNGFKSKPTNKKLSTGPKVGR